jgi:hypothetical protein
MNSDVFRVGPPGDDAEEPRPKGRERECQECHHRYIIEELWEDWRYYFAPPYNYEEGCTEYCLACWLCVGPND